MLIDYNTFFCNELAKFSEEVVKSTCDEPNPNTPLVDDGQQDTPQYQLDRSRL